MSQVKSWKLVALFSVLVMISLISPPVSTASNTLPAAILATPPLQVTSPSGGEIINPKSNPTTIGYTINGPNSAAQKASLLFTTNGGLSWIKIATVPISAPTLSVNAYTYDWTVPAQAALKTRCKVKVVVKTSLGAKIAAGTSDAFTILPFFAISGAARLNGNPLSGVTMTLSGDDTGTTVTDINGRYIFRDLLPGTYMVSAAKSEYLFQPSVISVTRKAGNFTTANFAALGFSGPAYTLSGTVSGATGTGVLVTLSGALGGSVMTDGSGNYAFSRLPAGNYAVTPSKAGYAFSPLSAAQLVNNDTAGVDFTSLSGAGAAYSISGRTLINAVGLPGVTVSAVDKKTSTQVAEAVTDASGKYKIKGLKNRASYTLTPSTAGGYTFSPVSKDRTIAGANITGLNFAVVTASTFAISGHILSANTNSAIPNVRVTLNTSPIITVKTDASGAYQFTGVPNGTYTLTPALAGASAAFYPASALVPVNGGDLTQNFGAQVAYTVSGSVNYSGTKHGRIYIGLRDANGGATRVSTSIPAPGPFAIRGVSPGSYILTARMDNLGWGTKNILQPNTTPLSARQVTVVAASLSNQNVRLFDPDLASLQTPSVPTGLHVFPGDSTALVKWKGDYSTNPERYIDQKELADSYVISWGTDTNATTGAPIIVPAYGQQLYIQTGLNNGDQLYYKISARLKGHPDSAPSDVVGPVTIGAIAPPNSVSGTVTLAAPVLNNAPLYVGLYGDNGIFFTPIGTLASSLSYSYTVTGVPNGLYQAFAFVDLQENNLLNVNGMSVGVDGRVLMPVVVNNSDATQDITVPSANSAAVAATNHFFDGTNEAYALLFGAARQKKLPVKVTLVSGPNVPFPMDIGREASGDPGSFGGFVSTGPFRPSAGDVYVFAVTYSDNTVEKVAMPVPAVLDSFAQNLSVDPTPSAATPTFSWSAPAAPPAPSYTYGIEVDEQGGGQAWSTLNSGMGLPASLTSVQYNFDNGASLESLATGSQYTWQVTVNDAAGDSATVRAPTPYSP